MSAQNNDNDNDNDNADVGSMTSFHKPLKNKKKPITKTSSNKSINNVSEDIDISKDKTSYLCELNNKYMVCLTGMSIY